ncbi:hypothetical protein BGZ83_000320 [Gryganskiella cystojenkinii]|nr:hypothetical protein BGZ83_000320 [Gryganskiella cystojenkinii]
MGPWQRNPQASLQHFPYLVYDRPVTGNNTDFLSLLVRNNHVQCLGLPWGLTKRQICAIATEIDGFFPNLHMLQLRRCTLEPLGFQDIMVVTPNVRHLKLVECLNVNPLTVWDALWAKASRLLSIRFEGRGIHKDQAAWDILTNFLVLVEGSQVRWEPNALLWLRDPSCLSPWQ